MRCSGCFWLPFGKLREEQIEVLSKANAGFYLVFLSVWDYSTGRVGAPLVCSEITLKDWEEGESTTQLYGRQTDAMILLF